MTAGCQSEVEERGFNFVECIQRVIRPIRTLYTPPYTSLSGERVHVSRYARACIPAMATRDALPLPPLPRTRFAFSKTSLRPDHVGKKETHHVTPASFRKKNKNRWRLSRFITRFRGKNRSEIYISPFTEIFCEYLRSPVLHSLSTNLEEMSLSVS